MMTCHTYEESRTGTLLVQMVVDTPRGPLGLLGGRRGVQVVSMAFAGVSLLAGAPFAAGSTGVVLSNMLARSCVTGAPSAQPHRRRERDMIARRVSRGAIGANSAMCIAGPELYPTESRGLGASIARLCFLLGSVPAASWVYADRPMAVIASGVAVANLLGAVLAATLPETAGVLLAGTA